MKKLVLLEMKIKIISFGKFKNSQAYKQIYNYYCKRAIIPIKGICRAKDFSWTKKLEHEKNEILKYISSEEYTLSLDLNGEDMSSETLSSFIFKIFSQGFKTINFLIGSEIGIHDEIKKSFKSLSFGKFTWPHLLVRVMLVEQIYRALEIKKI